MAHEQCLRWCSLSTRETWAGRGSGLTHRGWCTPTPTRPRSASPPTPTPPPPSCLPSPSSRWRWLTGMMQSELTWILVSEEWKGSYLGYRTRLSPQFTISLKALRAAWEGERNCFGSSNPGRNKLIWCWVFCGWFNSWGKHLLTFNKNYARKYANAFSN